jgi:ParB-like chromosome segregation protein Spo0J
MEVQMQHELKIEMVSLKDLKPHPKNRNKHSTEQIKRLVTLIEAQGFRVPIIVSSLSGYIVAGHGRLAAAKKMKLKKVPVIVQTFKDAEQEYEHLVADNAIAQWSHLQLGAIKDDLRTLNISNIDLLGLQEFSPLPNEIEAPGLNSGGKKEIEQITFTIHAEQAVLIRQALAVSKDMGPFKKTKNKNVNGNAIARICESFLNG